MAKFEVEMEIQGFKLRVKGEREEDLPRITTQVSRQIADMIRPPGDIAAGNVPLLTTGTVQSVSDNGQQTDKSKSRSRAGRRRSGTADAAPALSWQHDATKWGTPRQSWTAGQKILWTLYVASKELNLSEVSGPVIAETFSTAFRQFGPLTKTNMPRDLGSLKKKSPALVMDNVTNSPITWYLTDEGTKAAEQLVIEAKGDAPAAKA